MWYLQIGPDIVRRIDTMESTAAEFLPVMVPKGHVAEVYALIARLEGKIGYSESELARTDEVAIPPGDSLRATHAREWDAELVKRSWTESPRSMKLVLRHLAGAAARRIPIDELARVAYPDTGSRRQLAGALGAWGHRCSSRYGVKTWPFEVRRNDETGMYEYCLKQPFADLYSQHFD